MSKTKHIKRSSKKPARARPRLGAVMVQLDPAALKMLHAKAKANELTHKGIITLAIRDFMDRDSVAALVKDHASRLERIEISLAALERHRLATSTAHTFGPTSGDRVKNKKTGGRNKFRLAAERAERRRKGVALS